jgi:hypothetical protein
MKPRLVRLLLPALFFAANGAHAADTASTCADDAERAQELRAAGKLVASREALLACAQKACPLSVRDSCSEWLADVERRTPSIVVNARDVAGRDVATIRATIDGAPLPASVGVTAVRTDPGPHVVHVEADGSLSADESVVLREGEGVRVLAVTLRSKTEPTHAEAPRVWPSTLTWIAGGTALVGLGLFAGFGLVGASDYRALDRECAPRCSSDAIDGVRTKLVVADVGLVVGLIAAGVAVVSLFTSSPGNSTGSRRSATGLAP